MTRDLGIIVFPEFFQTEGVGRVLDNLQQRANVTAIATSPYVMRPVADGEGGREPPIDGGAGAVRLLDRPLWGRRDLFVKTSVSFEPDRSLYSGLRYQPQTGDEHTRESGPLVAAALEQARGRGLRTYLQVQAAIPPGYRVQFGGPDADDEPLMFDGSRAPDRLDKNGSLASPHIRDYTVALLRDLAQAYPSVDGFHIDWPEYPPYTLDSAFLDFNRHAEAAADRLGFDCDLMRRDAARLHDWMTRRMTFAELQRFVDVETAQKAFATALENFPGVVMACAFKARLAAECVADFRAATLGKQIVLRSFPPPWTSVSGFSCTAMAPLVDAICVKLFTMHWPMMVNSWASRLLRDNPDLGGRIPVACLLARLFDIACSPERFGEAIAEYPAPEQAHPVDAGAQSRKLAAAAEESGSTPVYAMAHGYGPVEDFSARLQCAWEGANGKLWINRYGYLSDEKLDAVGRICR